MCIMHVQIIIMHAYMCVDMRYILHVSTDEDAILLLQLCLPRLDYSTNLSLYNLYTCCALSVVFFQLTPAYTASYMYFCL